MKKIISLFQRDFNTEGNPLTREVHPDAQWVVDGEGVATQKWDGTSCLVRDGVLFKRFDAKMNRKAPTGFEPAQDEADPVTHHWPGWVPVLREKPEDRWHIEVFDAEMASRETPLEDGTYELCGPKINGNPDRLTVHTLIPHGKHPIHDFPRTYDEIAKRLDGGGIEGVVWHHPDGRMVKIKAKDFGVNR